MKTETYSSGSWFMRENPSISMRWSMSNYMHRGRPNRLTVTMSLNLLPTSPTGAMATQFLQVFNNGDKTARERFLETRLSARAKKERPVTEYLSLVQKAYRQSGGVEVVRVERTEPNPFVVHVKPNVVIV